MVQALGRALVARGHQVTVVGVSGHRQGTESDCGVRVVRLAHSRWPRTGFVVNGSRVRRTVKEIHRSHPIDIVEAPELGLAILPNRFPITTVLRMNGGHHFFASTLGARPRPWRSWLEKRSFTKADHLCAVSRFVAETTLDLLALRDRPVELLPNAVDTARFHPTGAPEDPHAIVFVGTLCEKKGVRQLLEAMPAILARDPEAHLQAAGRDWIDADGSYQAKLESVLDPAIADRIEFLGPVDHNRVPELLARAAVCVYPSHMEALPLAWLEAMATGRAIVASSTGPGPEVVDDGVSGLLCDPHDPAAIAEAVSRLLADPMLRRSLGAAARRRVLEQFSADVLAERNEAFYERCVAAGRRR